jgi:hypothetical protein
MKAMKKMLLGGAPDADSNRVWLARQAGLWRASPT